VTLLWQEQDSEVFATLFDVRRSIRYHERRSAWFGDLHRITNAMSILISGVVFVQMGGGEVPCFIVAITIVCALLSAFDWVTGYAAKADAHRSLRRRFCELEEAIIHADDNAGLKQWRLELLQIERDEPPAYRAVDLLCHNEAARSMGCNDDGDIEDVTCWQRLTCHLYRWPNIMDKPRLPKRDKGDKGDKGE